MDTSPDCPPRSPLPPICGQEYTRATNHAIRDTRGLSLPGPPLLCEQCDARATVRSGYGIPVLAPRNLRAVIRASYDARKV